MANSDVEVIIVGGGAAGLAAARRLHDAGVKCLLVEARPRLGGRAWTVGDAAGHALDLGCGWLHSADRNPWSDIAIRQGRSIDKTPPPWQRLSLETGFPLADQRDFIKAQHLFDARIDRIGEDGPDFPATAFLEPGCRWNPLMDAVSTYYSGVELDRVSARDLARYQDSNVNWRVADGFGATIAAYGADLPLVLGCPVLRIDHSGKRLTIETAMGTLSADQAIVTLPTAVVAEQELLFTPALPEKTEAAAGLPLGLADKLFLSLDGADEFEADSRLFGRIDRSETVAYHLRPFGRPMIECYFGGQLARELEAKGERGFFDCAVGELTGLLGSAFAHRVEPIRSHAWGIDPFSRGSYSYALPGKADCRATLAAPVDDRLFFAGEACHPDQFSTAHGALETGWHAAEQVIAVRGAAR